MMPITSGDLLAAKYRIEAEIGRGAFGRVYRARDTRLVAIKELHKGEDDLGSMQFSNYVRRFEREARGQAGLQHSDKVGGTLRSGRRDAGQGHGNGGQSSEPTSGSLGPASSAAGVRRVPGCRRCRSGGHRAGSLHAAQPDHRWPG